MENGIVRHWPVFLVVAAMGISFYTVAKVFKSPNSPLITGDLSYQMARPNGDSVPYDLSGRQVIRTILSRPAAPAMAAVVPRAPTLISPPTGPKPPIAKTPNKILPKAKQAALAKKKAADLAAAAAKAKAKVAVRVVEAAGNGNSKIADSGEKSNLSNETSPYVAPVNSNPPTAETNVKAHDHEEKPKLSSGQWRSLLFVQPSAKNGSDFLAAFHSKDLDAQSFYSISADLLSDTAADRQGLAIFILKQEDSAKTFSILVVHDNDKNPEPVKTQIHALVQSYAETPRFPALTAALGSTDSNVLSKATQLLNQSIDSQQATASISRNSRSPGSAPVSVSQLKTAVPALTRLLKSEDPGIVQQAQALIAKINALSAIQQASLDFLRKRFHS